MEISGFINQNKFINKKKKIIKDKKKVYLYIFIQIY